MSLPLISTKFNLPSTGAKIVTRRRLLETLDESLERNISLTLVCGPAGYGKTTIVSEWLRTSNKVHPALYAWLTLEHSDDELTRFLTYFVTALQNIHPDIGAGILKLLQTHKPSRIPALAALLINELNERSERFLLVLDDYHLITAEPILSFMAFLVDHQPPCLQLILVTRSDPALPLARLRGRGQLLEIRQQELCFLPSEAAEFLSQTMHLHLAPEQVETLSEKTEGWVSGLQLAAISLRGERNPAAFFKAFSGEHRFIADYLTDEVLERLPEHIRSFMLKTSVLERFTAALCEAVTGQRDSREILDQLLDSNLFIVPLDDQRIWYRYHNLFSDLLRKRLQSTQADIISELHNLASQWLDKNNMPEGAIDHAIAARNYRQAGWLIEGIAERLLMYGEAASLLRWLETIPEEQILAQPRLGSLYGITLTIRSRPLHLVVSLIEKMTNSADLGELPGEMDLLRAMLAVYQIDSPGAIRSSKQALQSLPPEQAFFRSLAADTLGMGYTLAWDIPAATQAFEQVVEISSQSDNVMMTIMGLTNLAGLSYTQGHLHKAITTCYQILELANQRIGSQSPMMGKTLFNLGEMLRERGDLDTALDTLLDSARMMELFSEIGLAVVNLAIARVYINKRDWQTAQFHIDRARQQAQATQPIQMDDRLVEVIQARYRLARGELDQAMQWAQSCGFLEKSPTEIFSEARQNPASYEVFQAECLTLVRLLLAQSQSARALEFLTLLNDLVESRQNRRRLIEVLALTALALHKMGKLDQALETLNKVLSLAEPEGYLRVFVDEGTPMERLLYQAATRGMYPSYIEKLLKVLAEENQSELSVGQIPSRAVIEPLSERELEVLRLIAEGLSNSEIAQRLFISLSTVKGHTSNIYGKLSVRNRTQALAQARRLGLMLSK